MPSYTDYRKYGHNRFTAATLSVHPAIWYGGFAAIGLIMACVL